MSKPKRARRSEQPKFSFLQHCLFCGENCNVVKDPRHPSRWRSAYSCREGETFGSRGLKEEILQACETRKDTQSEQIRVRMGGVLTDLHAADVRYHVDCKATFFSPKSIKVAVRQSAHTEHNDTAFDSVINYLAENKGSIHNYIDMYTKYVKAGGHMLSRRSLTSKVLENFGEDMIILSSPGVFIATGIQIKCSHSIPCNT